MGYGVLRSGALVATVPHPSDPLLGGGWRVQGRGRGHGVGLCQEGARDLARAGWSARSILAHYYPGATLSGAAAPAEAAADQSPLWAAKYARSRRRLRASHSST